MAKTLVIITSYNRPSSLVDLVIELAEDPNVDIVVFDDKSEIFPEILNKYHHVAEVIRSDTHRGKAGFWQTYQDIFNYCKSHEYDYYIILPDDVEPCPNFIEKAIEAYKSADCICLSLLLTNRSFLHGISRWGMRNVLPREWAARRF